ncbi:hypothetical protein AAG570_009995 [Ranatra chinensis]|uniref:Uncharacterized protein n=1 Tax=Ranatra chinensis TaxID=642074 RepID=A0ABD0Z3M5_9HEMI
MASKRRNMFHKNKTQETTEEGKSTIAATQYSERQLEYIGHLLRSMLTVRSITYHKSSSVVDSHSTREATSQLEAEDLVFLISSVLEQAKASLQSRCTTSHTKLDSYHCSVNCLLEEVRCAECRSSSDLQDDSQVVRELLKWLYRGMDRQDLLGRILRPYLASLFLVSHEACWHLPEWNERVHNQEQAALSEFNALVLAGHVTPADALTDAYDKDVMQLMANQATLAAQATSGVSTNDGKTKASPWAATLNPWRP